MRPDSDKRSSGATNSMLVNYTRTAARRATTVHALAVMVEREMINVGRALVRFQTDNRLRVGQEPGVSAVSSFLIAVFAEVNGGFDARFDVVACEGLG